MKIKFGIYSFVLVALLVSAFTGCDKNKITNDMVVKYGTSFGMCAGYCQKEIQVSSKSVIFTKRKNGNNPDTKTCTKTISEADLNNLKAIIGNLNISSFSEVIGCPDCADGGAEWIEVNTGNAKRKITFEYGNAPKELEALVAQLKTIQSSFADCE